MAPRRTAKRPAEPKLTALLRAPLVLPLVVGLGVAVLEVLVGRVVEGVLVEGGLVVEGVDAGREVEEETTEDKVLLVLGREETAGELLMAPEVRQLASAEGRQV